MNSGLLSFRSLLAILWGRRWLLLGVAGLVVAVALAFSLLQPPRYQATATLIIDFQEPVSADLMSPLAPALQPNYMATQIGIIASRNVAGRVVDLLRLEDRPDWQGAYERSGDHTVKRRDWIANMLLGSLQVVQGSNTRLVQISYTTGDPDKAAEIANAFAKAYEDTNLELNTRPALQEAAHLEQGLKGLRDKVEQAQQKLSAFQVKRGILTLDERLDVEMERLKELSTQRLKAEGAAQSATSRYRLISDFQKRGDGLETLPGTFSNDAIRQTKSDLVNREAAFAEVARQVGPRHPRYREALAQVRSLKAALRNEVGAMAEGARAEMEQARASAAGYRDAERAQKARVLELRQKRDALPALVRELDSAQASYEQGLNRVSQYLVQSRVSQTNVTLLAPSLTPGDPVGPDLTRTLAMAAALGLALAMAVALLLEIVDRRTRTPEDLEAMSVAPFLGRLPTVRP